MPKSTLILITAAAAAAGTVSTRGQGCVAARGAGLTCGSTLNVGQSGEVLPPETGFQASVNYRWFNSHRHFVGDDEQEQREKEGSQVENYSNFIDLDVTYAFSSRYSLTLGVPFVDHERSQVVRGGGQILERYSTQSSGLGDVRLEGNAWLLNPDEHHRWNILMGLGVSAPTGEDDAKDTFEVYDNTTHQIVGVRRTVDQSIQPGTGGWGITLDTFGYYTIIPRLNAYINGAYTFTPEEKNGVPTYRSNPFESIMSITDTYLGRAGLQYELFPKYGFSFSLGGRIEGVPVYDAIGGSEGFRRPGYAISIEPGISAMYKGWTASFYSPVALYRNREQSVPDKETTAATGVYTNGDAAFADFSVLFSLAKNF
jgi:hypothetical protein